MKIENIIDDLLNKSMNSINYLKAEEIEYDLYIYLDQNFYILLRKKPNITTLEYFVVHTSFLNISIDMIKNVITYYIRIPLFSSDHDILLEVIQVINSTVNLNIELVDVNTYPNPYKLTINKTKKIVANKEYKFESPIIIPNKTMKFECINLK